MRKHNYYIFLIVCFLLFGQNLFSQNVKIEIVDFNKKEEDKAYSTFQFANASYSASRSYLIFVTDKDNFVKTYETIPKKYNVKQEYTDIHLLGIENFKKDDMSDIEERIIENFINKILKYRNDNDLPVESAEHLRSNIVFLVDEGELCKYLFCR